MVKRLLMYDHATNTTKRLFAWMERLDRWGYLTVGLSLLAVSIGLFLNGWVVFSQSLHHSSLLFSSLTLVNNLLLVVILLELFRTIVRFLETDVLRIEPYLSVGIIACVRRMLTASAELGDLRDVSENFFGKYLKDMTLNAGIVILLIVGIFVLRSRPERSDQRDAPVSVDTAGVLREQDDRRRHLARWHPRRQKFVQRALPTRSHPTVCPWPTSAIPVARFRKSLR